MAPRLVREAVARVSLAPDVITSSAEIEVKFATDLVACRAVAIRAATFVWHGEHVGRK